MTQNQLPAWLQNEAPDNLADRLSDNLGSGAVPYLSIEGNRFNLIDAVGAEEPVQTYDPKSGPYVDVVIIDSNEHTCKIWYGEKYNPQAAAPPKCFSMNGVAPSRMAGYPQSPTCAACPKNIIGSEVSAMSGKPIKACRDYEFLAVLPPGDDMAFLLRVPPNSRTNLRDYMHKFRGQNIGVSAVVTRISFVAGVQGTLQFAAVSYIDQATYQTREAIKASKATDVLVGRTDVPRTEALPAPAAAPPAQLTAPAPQPPLNTWVPPNPMQGQPVQHPPGTFPAQPQPFAPAPFVPAGSPPPATFPAGAVATSPPAAIAPAAPSQSEAPRRKRRTKAEMAAAAGQAPQAAPGPQAGAPAPFMQQPAPAANGPAPTFGMAPGVAPDPQLQMTLDQHFPKAQ